MLQLGSYKVQVIGIKSGQSSKPPLAAGSSPGTIQSVVPGSKDLLFLITFSQLKYS